MHLIALKCWTNVPWKEQIYYFGPATTASQEWLLRDTLVSQRDSEGSEEASSQKLLTSKESEMELVRVNTSHRANTKYTNPHAMFLQATKIQYFSWWMPRSCPVPSLCAHWREHKHIYCLLEICMVNCCLLSKFSVVLAQSPCYSLSIATIHRGEEQGWRVVSKSNRQRGADDKGGKYLYYLFGSQ